MADTATTTSGNIYVQPADNTDAIVKEAEYELANKVNNATHALKDKVTADVYALDSNSQRRADANVLANSLAFQNLTAQANQDQATGTLASSLNFQNLTQQATSNSTAAALAQNLAAFQASAQADRVAQAQVIAGVLAANDIKANTNLGVDKIHTEGLWARQEARNAAEANVLAGYVTRDLVRSEADATRALMNTHYTESLRDKLNLQHQELVELKYENKRGERDLFAANFNSLQSAFSSNLNALSSQIQQVHAVAAQGLTNFGTMGANTQSASNQTA